MVQKYLIYALVDPITDKIRYIGRSSSGLSRPREHMTPKTLQTSRAPVHNWIRKLKDNKLRPKITIIKQWDAIDNDSLNKEEIEQISLHKVSDQLLNVLPGGEGRLGVPQSEHQKQAVSKALRGRKFSPETIELMKSSAINRKKHKSRFIVKASDGRLFTGYKNAAANLGCSLSYISHMISKQLCYNGITLTKVDRET